MLRRFMAFYNDENGNQMQSLTLELTQNQKDYLRYGFGKDPIIDQIRKLVSLNGKITVNNLRYEAM